MNTICVINSCKHLMKTEHIYTLVNDYILMFTFKLKFLEPLFSLVLVDIICLIKIDFSLVSALLIGLAYKRFLLFGGQVFFHFS